MSDPDGKVRSTTVFCFRALWTANEAFFHARNGITFRGARAFGVELAKAALHDDRDGEGEYRAGGGRLLNLCGKGRLQMQSGCRGQFGSGVLIDRCESALANASESRTSSARPMERQSMSPAVVSGIPVLARRRS
jgi:hypothetical protein